MKLAFPFLTLGSAFGALMVFAAPGVANTMPQADPAGQSAEAQLRDLTGPDQTLIIKGETTDQVTLTGVTNVRENVDLPSGRFDIYTLGNNGATVILEDDVSRTVV